MTDFNTITCRNWVEIDLDKFRQNIQSIRARLLPNVKILLMAKADAYGHGLVEMSREGLRNGIDMLGVANSDEGAQLRQAGIEAPIIVFSPLIPEEVEQIVRHRLTPAVSDLNFALALSRCAGEHNTTVPIHIELDTGFGRAGQFEEAALEIIRTCQQMPALKIEGIFTHYAKSDDEIPDFTESQTNRFRNFLNKLAQLGIDIPYAHAANSAGVLNFSDCNFDIVRIGLSAYGLYPSKFVSHEVKLEPVMEFKSRIVQIKDVPTEFGIGYGHKFTTTRPTRVATIPVGYGDGYDYHLTNFGEGLVHGHRVPIIGSVTMDMCMLDVTDVPEAKIGSEVTLLGTQAPERITAEEIASKAGLINYIVVCSLGRRAPRVYVQNGQPVNVEPILRRMFIVEEMPAEKLDTLIKNCLVSRSSQEIGKAVYQEIFENIFADKGKPLDFRADFSYALKFSDTWKDSVPEYIRRQYHHVGIRVAFTKQLDAEWFTVACAYRGQQVAELFQQQNCLYRWIYDSGRPFEHSFFKVLSAKVDGVEMKIEGGTMMSAGYLFRLENSALKDRIGKNVRYELNLEAIHDRNITRFPAYIVYPTRGVQVELDFEEAQLKNVSWTAFFAGREKYPQAKETTGKVSVSLPNDVWVFPNSGLVFTWT